VQSVNVSAVVLLATGLCDLAIDPRVQAPLDIVPSVRVSMCRCALPPFGDVHDLLVISPLVMKLSSRLGKTG
jgi:hypothetical protein